MPNERAILCGDVPASSLPVGGAPLRLRLWGPPVGNVNLQINDIASHLLQDVPSEFHDLL